MEAVFVAIGTRGHEFASIVVGNPRSSVLGNGDTASAVFLRRLRNSGNPPVVSRFASAEPSRHYHWSRVTLQAKGEELSYEAQVILMLLEWCSVPLTSSLSWSGSTSSTGRTGQRVL